MSQEAITVLKVNISRDVWRYLQIKIKFNEHVWDALSWMLSFIDEISTHDLILKYKLMWTLVKQVAINMCEYASLVSWMRTYFLRSWTAFSLIIVKNISKSVTANNTWTNMACLLLGSSVTCLFNASKNRITLHPTLFVIKFSDLLSNNLFYSLKTLVYSSLFSCEVKSMTSECLSANASVSVPRLVAIKESLHTV